MMKFLGVTAISALMPKIADTVGEAVNDLYHRMFGEEEEILSEPSVPRKKHDCTKFTYQMGEYIVALHNNSNKQGKEKAEILNRTFGLNKSVASYARIWHKDFDINTLPEGKEINDR